ncbi:MULTISPECIES: hypothetical protein [Bacillus]|nr:MULTISPECIES: hypothetical protein [Bacillus]MDN5388083.1 hypothetical protein [Bacillus sp. LB7]MEC1021238.1 hypothetical protein [Bacillus paralicheniformis]MEC1026363.1 hypothetical protein [Bacillus paralicheniformis]MEC1034864.1 hypothetical protein [Bacillus paralicheniformis]MEC1049872.1 hypothetical protein [Bacillus paralicheniformis]
MIWLIQEEFGTTPLFFEEYNGWAEGAAQQMILFLRKSIPLV